MTETTEVAVEFEETVPREQVLIDRPIQTVGRRKNRGAVRLVPGTGQFNLDGRTLGLIFQQGSPAADQGSAGDRRPGRQLRHLRPPRWRRSVRAGGRVAPRDRPSADPGPAEDRPALKKAGFLTRDPRAIERKSTASKGP